MKKIINASYAVAIAFTIAGCASNPAAGTIPLLENGEQRPPDISAKYVEQGAWFNSGKNEKLDYPDFADKKCQDRGFTRYKAYKSGYATSSSIAGLPSGDTSRNLDIWCE